MRAQRARRLAAVSAAGGAAIGAAGTAAAAAPAVHTQVTTNRCSDRGDWGGGCFDHRFDHSRLRSTTAAATTGSCSTAETP
ncbi:hypothetical protein ACFTY8_41375 [Streptomyces mirabilis]|uniref:hypothetical protein n=1 Tax=Streptomyces mirabilis TaxID=68239 RepID=UPI003640E06C